MKSGIINIVIFTLLFSSCKKNNSSTPPANLSNPNTPTLSDFFNSNAGSPQTMTLSASVGYSITGTKGTQLYVPVNAFMTGFGAIVTGTVEFSLLEVYSKKDMLLNKNQTMTVSDMLVNGGFVKLTANQNGQPLKLYPGKKITVEMPGGTSPSYSMQIFYGATDPGSGDLVCQLANGNPGVTVIQNTINVINPYYYSFNTDSLNWTSCDYFYNAAPKTNVTITVHGNYNASNTCVYLFFNGVKSVARLYGNSQAFSQTYQIPVGIGATIVAIARINGNFYASYTSTTITSNHLQDINLTPTSEGEILTKLATY